MKRPLLMLLWCLLGAAQLAVPASMIWKAEKVKREGVEIRLGLAPVDPADPFRGRYLALSFDLEREPLPLPTGVEPGTPLFLEINLSPDGYASAKELHRTPPPQALVIRLSGEDWYGASPGEPRQARFRLPFRRFYVNEYRAPEIEKQVAELTRRRSAPASQPVAFARAKLGDGEVVLLSLEGPDGPLH